MTTVQVQAIALVFVIIIVITIAAQFHWLRPGRVMTVLVFAAGAAVAVLMRVANIPPWWFAGGKGGFGLATTCLLSAWVTKGVEARAFGVPLLSGMGLTLLVLNVIALIRNAT
jgi:hypothetical protein